MEKHFQLLENDFKLNIMLIKFIDAGNRILFGSQKNVCDPSFKMF